MKKNNNFSKYLLLLILFIFPASTLLAQGYIDDLYYNKKNKKYSQTELDRQKVELNRQQSELDRQKDEQKRREQQQKKRNNTTTNQPIQRQSEKENLEDMEYYPGMFADLVSGNDIRQAFESDREEDNSKQSKSNVSISLVGWSPSWYGYANWGSPFYSPWYGSSFWYDPFYSYNWGWNNWGWNSYWGWGGYNPYWGYNPHWGHNHWGNNHWGNDYYYGYGNSSRPKYNRYNSTSGNGRRDGSIMVGSSSRDNYRPTTNGGRGGNFTITNQIRNMESNRGSNSSINNNNNNSTRPRPTVNNNNSNTQYNRRDVQTNTNTTTTRNNTNTNVNTNTNTNMNRGGGVGGSGGGVVQGTRRR